MSQQLLRRMRCKFTVEGRTDRDRYLVWEASSSLESREYSPMKIGV